MNAAGMGSRARAILWAQFRTLRNYLPRSSKFGLVFSGLLGLIWYGGFVTLAIGAAFLTSTPGDIPIVAKILPGALFLAFMYWQVIPVLLVSTGSALEIKKLVAYPIPKGELFGLEVLLRVSTGIEVVLVLTGAGIGLLLNPRVLPVWLGWRFAFGIGAVLGTVVLFFRHWVPESPRWLMIHDRHDEADRIVTEVEKSVTDQHAERLPPLAAPILVPVPPGGATPHARLGAPAAVV